MKQLWLEIRAWWLNPLPDEDQDESAEEWLARHFPDEDEWEQDQ